MNMESQPAVLVVEVEVRDKDGNLKYKGPLTFKQEISSPTEQPNGSNAQHSGS